MAKSQFWFDHLQNTVYELIQISQSHGAWFPHRHVEVTNISVLYTFYCYSKNHMAKAYKHSENCNILHKYKVFLSEITEI